MQAAESANTSCLRMPDDLSGFPDRIAHLAETLGVQMVAERSGLGRCAFFGLIRGAEPTDAQIIAIADACGVSETWLRSGEEAMP